MSDFISATEAADLLGVKRATLYAYVSRGLVRSEPGEGRRRRYSRADVERLLARAEARSGHGPVAAGALRWGEPVLETAVSTIDPERGPIYRRNPALELVEDGVGFEATAELLWADRLPAPTCWPQAPCRLSPAEVAALLDHAARPLDGVRLGVSLVAAGDPDRFAAPLELELERARALVQIAAASAALPLDAERVEAALGKESVAGTLAAALGVHGEAAEAALDRALVLCADHELNVSSFTARVVASAGADLYGCVGAALGAMAGVRHGGMCDRVEALAAEASRVGPERAVLERLRRGDGVPGFGHRLYPDGDPRATAVVADARSLAPEARSLEVLLGVAEAMQQRRWPPPSVDFGLVALARALGAPDGAAVAIFAVGRMAGWVAHALEQRQRPELLRPRAAWVG